jgi:hypothetical protein
MRVTFSSPGRKAPTRLAGGNLLLIIMAKGVWEK